ncbi:MAG: ABC transporter ATP-binding protein [Chitinophagales bacterium]|nr:ABC transporter ATP-binding protein [Chitinophagales bacterium]HAE13989.1 ABC transporter ATP-binding protein [Bacteroidota bacterium]MCB9019127.1 ABC transporter ATP-binding protein [Chitinophagales bacterium]MCB9021864.1 ABC transporter ATP-binding protein [Chitinophagales bacterium]MCB9030885.1 ABC transporter ATP-binding protein [Chitinophagales bacterium]
MRVELTGVSKRFNYDWIYRGIDQVFESGQIWAVTGANGSGKSTFLRMVAGMLTPSEGSIRYRLDGHAIDREKIFSHVAVTAPYIDLPEEFTLEENIRMQGKLKPYRGGLDTDAVAEATGLSAHRKKELRFFSSGMKQRLRNTLAILSDASLLIMDEPTSHLDLEGVEWYQQLLLSHASGRLILIGSNMERETTMAGHRLQMSEYKQVVRPGIVPRSS